MAFNSRQVLIGLAVVVLVAAAAVFFVVNRGGSGGGVLDTATSDAATTSTGTGTTAPAAADSELMVAGPLGDMALGDPNAPNVVIEYASMTCTHCQAFHQETWRPFKEKYIDTGKVYFILREFPLDPLATAAIVVARCAPKDQFFPLVDLMFDRQRDWAFVPQPAAALGNLVKQAGITPEKFQECLKNQQLLDGVNWVKDRATKEFGVDSTPTFFVNGEEMTGERDLASFDKLLGG